MHINTHLLTLKLSQPKKQLLLQYTSLSDIVTVALQLSEDLTTICTAEMEKCVAVKVLSWLAQTMKISHMTYF